MPKFEMYRELQVAFFSIRTWPHRLCRAANKKNDVDNLIFSRAGVEVRTGALLCCWFLRRVRGHVPFRPYRLFAVGHPVGNADQQIILSPQRRSGSAFVCLPPQNQNEFSPLDRWNRNHDDTKCEARPGPELAASGTTTDRMLLELPFPTFVLPLRKHEWSTAVCLFMSSSCNING